MRLYLVQHGDSLPEDVDSARPLSPRGRLDVQRLARFLADGGLRVSRVLHSGKLRARQTAEILAEQVTPAPPIEAVSGIDPLASTEPFSRRVNQADENLMVVGHMPFLGRLASRLLVDDETRSTVAFVPGTVVCLERGQAGNWSITWMVRPELLVRGGGEDV